MKATPAEQKALLELQELDMQIARVQHQVATNPQVKKLDALKGRQADLRLAVVSAEADLTELQRQIDSVSDESIKVRERQALQQDRLNGGKVAARDMSALEHEIERMAIRLEDLETQHIDLLDRVDALESGIAASRKSAQAILEDEQQTRSSLGAEVAAAEEHLSDLRAQRESLVAQLNSALASSYEAAQRALGTQAVIEVRDGYAAAAPVELPAVELSAVAAMGHDEVYLSEETEYLLVRTTSG